MIYKITKTIPSQTKSEDDKVVIFEIDDLIPFGKQPIGFKELFKAISEDNRALFDNADVMLFAESGRVIISNTNDYAV